MSYSSVFFSSHSIHDAMTVQTIGECQIIDFNLRLLPQSHHLWCDCRRMLSISQLRVQPSAYPMYLVTYLAIYHSLSRLVTIHCLAVLRCLSTQASIYFMQQNMLQQLRTSCIPSLLLLYNAIKRLWPSCPLAVQIPLVQLLPLQQLGQSQLGLRPRIPA